MHKNEEFFVSAGSGFSFPVPVQHEYIAGRHTPKPSLFRRLYVRSAKRRKIRYVCETMGHDFNLSPKSTCGIVLTYILIA